MNTCFHFLLIIFLFSACSTFTSSTFLEEEVNYYVNSSGTKLPVFESQNGDSPIILIHGGPGLPGYMNSLADLLQSHKVIRYYQRESFLSKSNGPYDMRSQVADLKSIVENTFRKYKIKPIILGHSLGAVIATEFAKKHGELVTKIILVSPAEYYRETGKLFLQNMDKILLARDPDVYNKAKKMKEVYEEESDDSARILGYHQRLRLFWPAYFASKKIPKKLKFAKAEYRKSNKTESDYFKLVRSGDLRKGISKIKNDVVHISGEKDILPYSKTRMLFEKKLKSYKFEEIKNAGHFPWLESRDEFKRVLNSYLSGIKEP